MAVVSISISVFDSSSSSSQPFFVAAFKLAEFRQEQAIYIFRCSRQTLSQPIFDRTHRLKMTSITISCVCVSVCSTMCCSMCCLRGNTKNSWRTHFENGLLKSDLHKRADSPHSFYSKIRILIVKQTDLMNWLFACKCSHV